MHMGENLANLRNRDNSQKYPSTYEHWRPKIVEDTEKSDGKESASDNKVQHGDQGGCSPRFSICQVCHRTLERQQGQGFPNPPNNV